MAVDATLLRLCLNTAWKDHLICTSSPRLTSDKIMLPRGQLVNIRDNAWISFKLAKYDMLCQLWLRHTKSLHATYFQSFPVLAEQ